MSLNVLQWNGLFLADKIPLLHLNVISRDEGSVADKSKKMVKNVGQKKSVKNVGHVLLQERWTGLSTRRRRVQNK